MNKINDKFEKAGEIAREYLMKADYEKIGATAAIATLASEGVAMAAETVDKPGARKIKKAAKRVSCIGAMICCASTIGQIVTRQ